MFSMYNLCNSTPHSYFLQMRKKPNPNLIISNKL